MIDNKNGGTKWYPINTTPPTDPGNRASQEEEKRIRREKTIICTARALGFGLSKEEIDQVINTNAKCIGMDPNELRASATKLYNLNSLENQDSTKLERE
ncbi:MAG: hypothetical protein ACOX0X_00650 [Candidatus Dojkabacteria bacterium]